MRDLVELKDRINRLLDELMSRGGSESEPETGGGDWSPKVDLYEMPDRIMLRADLPGVSSDSMDLRIEGGQLVLTGKRQPPQDIDASAIRRLERPFGAFVRRYHLPDGIDPERVAASYVGGVLEIVIQKREETAVRRIPVKLD